MGHPGDMAITLPIGIRVAAGLIATAVDRLGKLPENLPAIGVSLVGQAFRTSLQVRQEVAALAARGDEVLSSILGGAQEHPTWATFDEDEDVAAGSPAAGAVPAPAPASAAESLDGAAATAEDPPASPQARAAAARRAAAEARTATTVRRTREARARVVAETAARLPDVGTSGAGERTVVASRTTTSVRRTTRRPTAGPTTVTSTAAVPPQRASAPMATDPASAFIPPPTTARGRTPRTATPPVTTPAVSAPITGSLAPAVAASPATAPAPARSVASRNRTRAQDPDKAAVLDSSGTDQAAGRRSTTTGTDGIGTAGVGTAGVGTAAVGAAGIDGDHDLSVADLKDRLRDLDAAAVSELLRQEEAGPQRAAYLTLLANRLTTLQYEDR